MLVSAKFDRSTVKRALQNSQNDCHQWLSLPRTPLGELTALPRLHSWFKGDTTSKGKGRGGKRGRPHNANPWIRLCFMKRYLKQMRTPDIVQ